MSCILETKDLKKYYGKEPNITKALDAHYLMRDLKHGNMVLF